MVVLNSKDTHANQKLNLFHHADSVSKPEANDIGNEAEIANIAYLKAEKRGFLPGYELSDWLEAEQELISA